MRLDQLVEWHQRVGRRAHLIGKGLDAERRAFAGKALSLAVEGLVLSILLEQSHREKAGAHHLRPQLGTRTFPENSPGAIASLSAVAAVRFAYSKTKKSSKSPRVAAICFCSSIGGTVILTCFRSRTLMTCWTEPLVSFCKRVCPIATVRIDRDSWW